MAKRRSLGTSRSKSQAFRKAAKRFSHAKPKQKGRTKNEAGKLVPNRNIDNDGITYSFLSEFLSDRESARLTYVEGWQQTGVISALEFGQMIHSCLEATALNKNVPPSCQQIIKQYIVEKAKYTKLSKSDIKELELLGQVAAIVFPLYHQFWTKHKGVEFSPTAQYVSQEEKFEVPHSFHFTPNDGSEPYIATMSLRGRFDSILRIDGKLWLMENKTKSQIDEDGLTASLAMDLQTMLYCQAINLKYGECPAGVLYNVIKRPGHRFGKNDTTTSFLQRIQDSVEATPSEYFMRWHVSITEEELAEWVSRSLNPILCQVKRWWDSIKKDPFNPWHSPEHFFNPESLYGRYGRSRYFNLHTRKSTYGLQRNLRKK